MQIVQSSSQHLPTVDRGPTASSKPPNPNLVIEENSTVAPSDVFEKWDLEEGDDRTLFIVDAFGLLFRSYYALAKTTMSSRDMFDTRAVYGFTMVMLSFLKKHAKGNPVAVVFEGRKLKGQTDFRTAVYPDYKGSRGPTPTGIVEAVPWVKRMCKVMGLAVLEVDLFEADDTIGTLVSRARQSGARSVIVSMDKDFRQLLDGDHVRILRPKTGGSFEYVTEESFRNDYSDLHPRQYVDVLTLIGDASDGLKGVPGIGKQMAPRLIAAYHTVEALLASVRRYFEIQEATEMESDQSSPPKSRLKSSTLEGFPFLTKRVASSLRDNEKHALLVKTLITIRTNVPLTVVSWESLQRKPVEADSVKELLDVLEFTNRNIATKILLSADDVVQLKTDDEPVTLMDRIESRSNATEDAAPVKERPVSEEQLQTDEIPELTVSEWGIGDVSYVTSPSNEQIDSYLEEVRTNIGVLPVLSKSGRDEQLIGIALSTRHGSSMLIRLKENCSTLPERLVAMLSDKRIEKRGWFLKKLYKHLLQAFSVRLEGKLFENRIASELLHAGESITDARLSSMYLGKGALDPWITGRDHRISAFCTPEDSLSLCDIGFRLSEKLREAIDDADLSYVLDYVELPLIPVLGDMELTGVPINSDGLQEFESRVRTRIEGIEAELKEIVPPPKDPKKAFRPSSRDDVASLIFDTWQIDLKVKKTASGRFPVDKKVITLLSEDHRVEETHRRFAKLMLEYREAAKILSTYTKSLLSAVEHDGRIRATFVQEAAATGRLSTSGPNLQSIPVRSHLGREVRSMVQPSPQFSILCADYSQIELRIIASLSKDEGLLSAFTSGTDVHRSVAAKVFKVESLGDVTDEQRRSAKEVNYGIPYGITPYGLGQHLGISARDAKVLMSQFHEEFPRVKRFTEQLTMDAKNSGCARSLLGRRLSLPLIRHGGPSERKAAERVAVNMPIQGTQADMIKLAMIRIADRLRCAKAESRMIMQLHDELVLEVKQSELEAVMDVVEEEMISAIPLRGVDVVVNTGVGNSWLNAAHS